MSATESFIHGLDEKVHIITCIGYNFDPFYLEMGLFEFCLIKSDGSNGSNSSIIYRVKTRPMYIFRQWSILVFITFLIHW